MDREQSTADNGRLTVTGSMASASPRTIGWYRDFLQPRAVHEYHSAVA